MIIPSLSRMAVVLALAAVAPSSPAVAQHLAGGDELSPGCKAAQRRAQTILAVLDRKASTTINDFAHNWFAKAGADIPPAAAWNAFAGNAYSRGHADAALWAEVHALQVHWLAEYVANAGVYLVSLKNPD